MVGEDFANDGGAAEKNADAEGTVGVGVAVGAGAAGGAEAGRVVVVTVEDGDELQTSGVSNFPEKVFMEQV